MTFPTPIERQRSTTSSFEPRFAFSKRCETQCAVCSDNFPIHESKFGGRKYESAISNEDAARLIQDHAKTIKESHEEIAQVVRTRGDQVLTRWTKALNATKRKDVISRALPESLSKSKKWAHIGEYTAYASGRPSKPREALRETFLLPLLDKEQLAADPNLFLVLVDLRQRFSPSQWVWEDYKATEWGRGNGILATRFNEEVFFSTSDDDYGKPVEYQHDKFHRQQHKGFPVTEVLFEAQRNLYVFIAKALRLLLEKAEAKETGDSIWKTRLSGVFSAHAANETGETPPLFEHISLFGAPMPSFDSIDMLAIAEERQDSYESDLWLLQTDPAFAYETITYLLRGTYFDAFNVEEKFQAIAHELCEPLLMRCRIWGRASLRLTLLKYFIDHKDTRNLPYDVDHIKDLAHHLFGNELRHQAEMICDLLLKDPTFNTMLARREGKRLVHLDGEDRFNKVVITVRQQSRRQLPADDYKNNPLQWALSEIAASSLYPNAPSMTTLMCCYLDDLMRDGRLNPARESPRVIEALEDFSTLQYLMSSIEVPPRFLQRSLEARQELIAWATNDEDISKKLGLVEVNGYELRNAPESKEDGGGDGYDLRRFKEAGELLKKFWDLKFPADRRQRKVTWLEKAEKSKEALNAFWEAVRKIKIAESQSPDFKVGFRKASTDEQIREYKDIWALSFWENQEYLNSVRQDLAELREEKEQKEPIKTRKRSAEDHATPQTQWGDVKTSPKRARHDVDDEKKTKRYQTSKQDPEPRSAPTATTSQAPPASPDEIPVAPKILQTLGRLWPIQSRAPAEGTVRFDDFLTAMEGVGLHHEHVGGSRVSFKGVGKTLLLHAPHGGGKTPVKNSLLQTYGRRLTRRFGWTWKTFRVAG